MIYNAALHYTTAARGSLALSTLPLVTMLVAVLLGREALTTRKTAGVLIAITGVTVALGTGLATAPASAWQGDLLMVGGTSVWLSTQSGRGPSWRALVVWASSLLVWVSARRQVHWLPGTRWLCRRANFSLVQWLSVLSIGAFGGAAAFSLWVYALERTTQTRVANTMTVNPITASLIATLIIGEAVGVSLIVGMVAVFVGIWVASTER